jgi:hypothetical protein
MATPVKYNEAESGSLALRLAPLPHEASPDRVAPSRARSATCQTGNFQGELLSAHKIGQALPGTPGLTGLSGLSGFFRFIFGQDLPDEIGEAFHRAGWIKEIFFCLSSGKAEGNSSC